MQTTLSSICHFKAKDTLSSTLLYCNQLRVLITLVAKTHIFADLTANDGNLSFIPDQNYFSRVRTMIVKGGISRSRGEPIPYSGALAAAKVSVCDRIPLPDYTGPFSGIVVSSIMAYICRQISTNLSIHTRRHAFHCLSNFIINQIRAGLPHEQFDVSPKQLRINIGTIRKNLAQSKPELFRQQTDLKSYLDILFNDETPEGKKWRTCKLVSQN